MFGFSFWELVVVAIVALVVIGPKDLPKMLRKLGQYAGKLRRMAADLRAQSGIDDALRSEGLADDIAEIRKLARGEIDKVQSVMRDDTGAPLPAPSPSRVLGDFHVYRDREFPRDGADAFGALPDNAIVYAEGLPKSKWGKDALYMMGDETAELPSDAVVEPFFTPDEPEPAGPVEHEAFDREPGETDASPLVAEDAHIDDNAEAPARSEAS